MKHIALAATLAFTACYSGGDPLEGWGRAAQGLGPVINWDIDHRPLPDIPFPNDVATRPDPRSPTGRRVNASLLADTSFEVDLRQKLAELDGFGTSAPMWISFRSADPTVPAWGRLDLEAIAAAQTGDMRMDDDVLFLIDITAASPTYGQALPLDVGNGNYPPTIEDPDEYFMNDPRGRSSNLMFETEDEDADDDGRFDHFEDVNQNGTLDPGEDVDGDGRLDPEEDTDGDETFDEPNTWATFRGEAGLGDPYTDLITFYELESNSLIFRPLAPLREATTYAVVLTKRLRGVNGEPIRSPFPYVHHTQQREALRPLFQDGLLERHGLTADDVAFTWSFTTQSVTRTMVELRDGLYGKGPFAELSRAYPAVIEDVVPIRDGVAPDHLRLPASQLVEALEVVFERFNLGPFDSDRVQNLITTYNAVDYILAGDYVTPNLLDAGGGVFELGQAGGRLMHQPESIRFMLIVPKQGARAAPFPVALYCHGYTSMKLEALAFAGVLARFGIATFVIDAVSHGLPLGGEEYEQVIQSLVTDLAGVGLVPFYEAIRKDRARDLNGDSLYEPGGDFWTSDVFHTRDIVRQSVLDYLQAARVLRGFDGVARWPFDMNGNGQLDDLAGDFNGDGVVDVGGPDAPFYAMGTSMGGILSSILAGVEPRVVAAAPISPGGGLFEIGLRTGLSPVQRAVFLPIFGPMVVSEPVSGDERLTKLEWMVNDVFSLRLAPFARVGELRGGQLYNELRGGDRVRVDNLKSGAFDEIVVPADRRFRAHVAADRGDPIAVTVTRPDGTLVKRIDTFETAVESFQGARYAYGDPLVAIQQGMGLRRVTPALRRLLGIAQMGLDAGDPVNFATRYHTPLSFASEPALPKNVLFIVTLADETVPVSTGVNLARAAGVLEHREVDPVYGMTQNQLLIERHVVEAIESQRYFARDPCHYDPRPTNFDIDDLSRGQHPDDLPRLGLVRRPPECSDTTAPAMCATSCPELPPLRATVRREHGISALRVPALNPRGQHAIDIPDPSQPFDPSTFVLNQIGLFLSTNGTLLSDHVCLAKDDCSSCSGQADCPSLPPKP